MINHNNALKEKHFLFLEITDPDVNALFSAFSRIIYGVKLDKSPHLTVRGPYSKRIPQQKIEKWKELIKLDALAFGESGMFENPNECVVYIKIDSPNLRKIWYKPDFPIHKFGFNPHISIYRGKNKQLASALMKIFKNENLELYCAEYCLVEYVSRIRDLFPDDFPLANYPQRLMIKGRLKEDFIERLILAVNKFKI